MTRYVEGSKMMIKFVTNLGVVETRLSPPLIQDTFCVREDSEYVYLPNYSGAIKKPKVSKTWCYFHTWEEARSALLAAANRRVIAANKMLHQVQAMRPLNPDL